MNFPHTFSYRRRASLGWLAAIMIGAKICVGADRPDPQPAAPVAEAATKRESDIAVDKEVVRQIQNLGSDFDEIADAAEASLLKLKYRAVEALEKTCKHANPDVARRAERLLAKIDEHTLTVLDATGTPIVGGKLELILHPKTFTFVPDERGRILVEKPASPKDDLHKFFIGGYNTQARFSHPEYGATGWTPIYFSKPGKQVFPVPLVKRGSEAYDRARSSVSNMSASSGSNPSRTMPSSNVGGGSASGGYGA